MKNRHFKSIEQRFGTNVKDRKQLGIKVLEFTSKLKFYYNNIKKSKKEYNFNDALNFCSVMSLGTFYMKALCEDQGRFYRDREFGEAAYIVTVKYETPPQSVKFSEIEFMEYSKFDVLFVSEDGYMCILFHDLYNDLDYNVVKTEKVKLNGNIGKLQKD